jgi:hypothetical protein
MSFESLITKVRQAESALEAKERQAAADFRQLKSSWRDAWTPGRIVIAGLVTGFLVGKLEPEKKVAKGGSVLQLLTALGGMLAGGSAQVAAVKAEDAAESAEQVAEQVPPP